MPGPVEIAEPIRQAFHLPPASHRSEAFVARYEAVRERLRLLTNAPQVALFQGSGTLANDVIASNLQGTGLILSNGEFGERLIQLARAWDLKIRTVESPWGRPWDLERASKAMEGIRWIWGVHLETSTGMVNDFAPLRDLAQSRGARLCLDCVSSLGTVPLDLRGVWLASSASGKALGSYAGVSMVFASEIPAARRVPVYLDLAAALSTQGSRFTFSTPLLEALGAALEIPRDYVSLGGLVRQRLHERAIAPLVDGDQAAPTVTTFHAPFESFLDRCRELGYLVGGESGYLRQRGLAQIATMGAVAASHIEDLFQRLA